MRFVGGSSVLRMQNSVRLISCSISCLCSVSTARSLSIASLMCRGRVRNPPVEVRLLGHPASSLDAIFNSTFFESWGEKERDVIFFCEQWVADHKESSCCNVKWALSDFGHAPQ